MPDEYISVGITGNASSFVSAATSARQALKALGVEGKAAGTALDKSFAEVLTKGERSYTRLAVSTLAANSRIRRSEADITAFVSGQQVKRLAISQRTQAIQQGLQRTAGAEAAAHAARTLAIEADFQTKRIVMERTAAREAATIREQAAIKAAGLENASKRERLQIVSAGNAEAEAVTQQGSLAVIRAEEEKVTRVLESERLLASGLAAIDRQISAEAMRETGRRARAAADAARLEAETRRAALLESSPGARSRLQAQRASVLQGTIADPKASDREKADAQRELNTITAAQQTEEAAIGRHGEKMLAEEERQHKREEDEIKRTQSMRARLLGNGYNIRQAGDTLLGAGAVGAGVLGGTALAAGTFNDSYLNAVNNTDLSKTERADLRRGAGQIIDAGTDQSPDEVFGALKQASDFRKEGQTFADTLQIVDVAVKAASADNAKASDTTKALARAMFQFNAPARDAGRIMNVLETVAAKNNLTLEELTENSGRAAAAAAEYGVPLQEVIAAYGVLTKEGYTAGQSATALRSIFTSITQPSTKAWKAIKELSGVYHVDLTEAFGQANLKARGLAGVFEYLNTALHGNKEAMQRIFPDARSNVAAMSLMTDRSKDLTDTIKEANIAWQENSRIQGQFNERSQTASFQLKALINQLLKAADSLGVVLLPKAIKLISALTSLVKWIDALNPKTKDAAVNFGIAATAVLLLTGGLLKFAGSVIGVINGIQQIIKFLGVLKLGAAAAGLAEGEIATAGIAALGPASLWVAAVVAAAAVIYGIVRAFKAAGDAQDAFAAKKLSLKAATSTGDVKQNIGAQVQQGQAEIKRQQGLLAALQSNPNSVVLPRGSAPGINEDRVVSMEEAEKRGQSRKSLDSQRAAQIAMYTKNIKALEEGIVSLQADATATTRLGFAKRNYLKMVSDAAATEAAITKRVADIDRLMSKPRLPSQSEDQYNAQHQKWLAERQAQEANLAKLQADAAKNQKSANYLGVLENKERGRLGITYPKIDRFNGLIQQAAQQTGVDGRIIKTIINNETGGDPLATNYNPPTKGNHFHATTDYGIMQVNSDTKNPDSYNWRDPLANMIAGATEFKGKLAAAHGDLREGFRRYNGRGPKAEAYADKAMAFLGNIGNGTYPGLPAYMDTHGAAKPWGGTSSQKKRGTGAGGLYAGSSHIALDEALAPSVAEIHMVSAYADALGSLGKEEAAAIEAARQHGTALDVINAKIAGTQALLQSDKDTASISGRDKPALVNAQTKAYALYAGQVGTVNKLIDSQNAYEAKLNAQKEAGVKVSLKQAATLNGYRQAIKAAKEPLSELHQQAKIAKDRVEELDRTLEKANANLLTHQTRLAALLDAATQEKRKQALAEIAAIREEGKGGAIGGEVVLADLDKRKQAAADSVGLGDMAQSHSAAELLAVLVDMKQQTNERLAAEKELSAVIDGEAAEQKRVKADGDAQLKKDFRGILDNKSLSSQDKLTGIEARPEFSGLAGYADEVIKLQQSITQSAGTEAVKQNAIDRQTLLMRVNSYGLDHEAFQEALNEKSAALAAAVTKDDALTGASQQEILDTVRARITAELAGQTQMTAAEILLDQQRLQAIEQNYAAIAAEKAKWAKEDAKQNKEAEKAWDEAQKHITTTLTDSLTDMLNHHKSHLSSVKEMWRSVFTDIEKSIIEKFVASAVLSMSQMLNIPGTPKADKSAAGITGSIIGAFGGSSGSSSGAGAVGSFLGVAQTLGGLFSNPNVSSSSPQTSSGSSAASSSDLGLSSVLDAHAIKSDSFKSDSLAGATPGVLPGPVASAAGAVESTAKTIGSVGGLTRVLGSGLGGAFAKALPVIGAALAVSSLVESLMPTQKPDYTTRAGAARDSTLSGKDYTSSIDSGYSDTAGMRQLMTQHLALQSQIASGNAGSSSQMTFHPGAIVVNGAASPEDTANAVMQKLTTQTQISNAAHGSI